MSDSSADKQIRSRQVRTLLLATDNKSSILAEIADGKLNSVAYSAYGRQSAQDEVETGLGFNGALREKRMGWYLLGNGYRAYNPTLMRFHSPDSWSPFGSGGLNAYTYCEGDPISFSDPTGHGLWGLLKLFVSENVSITGASQSSINARNAASVAAATKAYAGWQPLGGARTTSALVSNSSSFTELGGVSLIFGAPGPRNGIPRQTSYNHGLPNSVGYVEGAAASGLTMATIGGPPRSSFVGMGTASRTAPRTPPPSRRQSTSGISRDGRNLFQTQTDRYGNVTNRPLEPVRGGGDRAVPNDYTPDPTGRTSTNTSGSAPPNPSGSERHFFQGSNRVWDSSAGVFRVVNPPTISEFAEQRIAAAFIRRNQGK